MAISIAIPLAVGGLSALLTMDAMKAFASVTQPPLSPPPWLFAPVWTILYILMGIASYLVYTSSADAMDISKSLRVYGISLIFNFFWSIIFFNLKNYLFAAIWLLALLIMIIYLAVLYYRISKIASYMIIPYILWCTFALYLNIGVYILN